MKQLHEGTSADNAWSKQIIADLSFIKSRLRYPMRRKLLLPLVFWTVFFLLIAAVSLFAILDKTSSPKPFFAFLPLIAPVILIVKYVQGLKFVTVHTPFTLADNIRLLDRFLTQQRMLIFRHPDAPEVFQILSRDISSGGSEEREVMLFIADDRRILVNSQFTNSGWRLPQGKSHIHEMCERLMRYMKTANRSDSLDLQRF